MVRGVEVEGMCGKGWRGGGYVWQGVEGGRVCVARGGGREGM